jgi:hypothetical protein
MRILRFYIIEVLNYQEQYEIMIAELRASDQNQLLNLAETRQASRFVTGPVLRSALPSRI